MPSELVTVRLSDVPPSDLVIAERNYRKGYHQGYAAALRHMEQRLTTPEAKAVLAELEHFQRYILGGWRRADHQGCFEVPPEPCSRKGSTGHA